MAPNGASVCHLFAISKAAAPSVQSCCKQGRRRVGLSMRCMDCCGNTYELAVPQARL
jgi:hypothetical protein